MNTYGYANDSVYETHVFLGLLVADMIPKAWQFNQPLLSDVPWA